MIGAIDRHDLARGGDVDPIAGQHPADQVLRHRRGQRVLVDHDGDARAPVGEVQRGLPSRVPAAEHEDMAAVRPGLQLGGGVVDPGPLELLPVGQRQAADPRPARGHHRPRGDRGAVGQAYGEAPVRRHGDTVDAAWAEQRRAEALRLDGGPGSQLSTGYPVGEAEVVLDARARAGLAAGREGVQDSNVESFRGPVHRCRQPGGPGADDHDVIRLRVVRVAAKAKRRRQSGRVRVHQHAGGRDHHRQVITGRADAAEDASRVVHLVDVDPLVRRSYCGSGICAASAPAWNDWCR